jgi:DNA uptake protein ComE-like DNA-binding protein
MAAKIVAARADKPFASVDDLRRVSGIGPKTLDAIRPYLTVKRPEGD